MKANYKPISPAESTLFKTEIQRNNTEFEFPWHYHPEYELTYIQKSHGVRYVGNNIENFFDDDLVLVGPNLPHCWINSENQQEVPSAVVLYIKEDFIDNTWMQSHELDAIHRLLRLSVKGIKFDRTVSLKLKARFIELPYLQPFEKLILLLEILHELAHTTQFHCLCEQGFSYDLNQTNNIRINAVYKYIREHYQEKITLAVIAEQVNMAQEYFSRFFSKTMKKSFFEFLNEYKINRACKLLIETDKQISEICYESGFESIPFFYRQFKKFKNCQPKNYRQNYQKFPGE